MILRAAFLACPLTLALARAEPLASMPEVVVRAPAPLPLASASERVITAEEIASRPIARPGEILEAAPGLIASQHSGEGKANQYFLRGFNLDHGTDLAITLDGMPLNMRSHAHGQGYADLNFLIPELLAEMRVRKGPYGADQGDFANAGQVDLSLRDSLPRPILQTTMGSFGYWRGLAAGSQALGPGRLLLAGEITAYDGPWERADRLRRFNGLARYSQGGEAAGFSLTAMAYSGRWNATDQVPARAVSAGLIGRFGTLDPSDGGLAARYSLSANAHLQGESGTTRAQAYAIRSTLDLFSNFTYFLDNPAQGDQFQQRDRRWVLGFDVSHSMPGTLLDRPLTTRIGVQGRHDEIALGLYRTEGRALLATLRRDALRESSLAIWGDATWRATDWLRATLGLRGDVLGGRVQSDLAANSGTAAQAIASPRGGLVFGPWWRSEIFLNAGMGFHSNDLRGATITVDPTDGLSRLSPVPLLVRARGAEIGLRQRLLPELETSLAFFVLTLGSEIIFVGDAGTTEASRPSRRIGVEWTSRWRPLPWLALEADIAATQARFTDQPGAGRYIPGAPNLVAAAGLVLGDGGPGWFADTRLRIFGARPLVEDNSTRSSPTALVNLRGGYRFENGVTARLDGLNLLGARASQIDYFYVSRLRGEAAGVAGRHFHPVEPVAIRLTLSVAL